MQPQTNYFAHETAAKRYAESRPYFQPMVIARIKEFLGLTAPVPNALDIACGTGNSSIALVEIAEYVQAIDSSAGMLAQAPAHPRITYRESPAEALPFEGNSFDLITVSMAFHWLDHERFLSEASRVLRPTGWLVVYNNRFSDIALDNKEFSKWRNERFLQRYPRPPRQDAVMTAEEVKPFGLRLVKQESYEDNLTFTKEAFARYLMTLSHVNAAVEHPTETFIFAGNVWYVQREE